MYNAVVLIFRTLSLDTMRGALSFCSACLNVAGNRVTSARKRKSFWQAPHHVIASAYVGFKKSLRYFSRFLVWLHCTHLRQLEALARPTLLGQCFPLAGVSLFFLVGLGLFVIVCLRV